MGKDKLTWQILNYSQTVKLLYKVPTSDGKHTWNKWKNVKLYPRNKRGKDEWSENLTNKIYGEVEKKKTCKMVSGLDLGYERESTTNPELCIQQKDPSGI